MDHQLAEISEALKLFEPASGSHMPAKVPGHALGHAETLARVALATAPQLAQARALLAQVHFAREEWREAAFQAREALRLEPKLGSRYSALAVSSQKNFANMLSNPHEEGLLWFIGRTVRRYPDRHDEYANLSQLIDKFVLPGWLPETPPFTKGSRLLTLGSCFALELRNHLEGNGLDTEGLWIPEGLNNTYALRQFIQWCVSGTLSDDSYWYDEDEDRGAHRWTPSHEQERYRALFREASGFVITVGLAEVWSDCETGGVFWRGVPRSKYDAERYELRMTTVEENEANLRTIVSELRSLGAGKPIILTLSPVPLRATFREQSCMTIDCVSKSILRVAIDRVTRPGESDLYYWPSYEMVKSIGCHIETPVFGVESGDQRHVSKFMPPLIVDRFIAHYFR